MKRKGKRDEIDRPELLPLCVLGVYSQALCDYDSSDFGQCTKLSENISPEFLQVCCAA